jgi:hypothetical protein
MMVLAAMTRRTHTVVAMLCLLSVATCVPADDGRAGQRTAVSSGVTYSHTIHGMERARLHDDGALVVADRVSGTGNINADHVVIEGELSPGHSPGCVDFGGDVTFSASATLLIEIGGNVPCMDYDRISVAYTLTINGATLEVILINGFDPQFGDRFDIMDWGSIIGTFATIDTSVASLNYPLAWDTSQLYLTGEVIVGVQHIADGDLAPWGNPDGQINAADVLIATQLVLGQRTPGALQYAHGDMNLDDVLDLADLLLIQKSVLQ